MSKKKARIQTLIDAKAATRQNQNQNRNPKWKGKAPLVIVLLWKVCAVVCAAGFLSVFAQQSITLHEKKDARFGMNLKKMWRGDDSESGTTRTDGLVEKDVSNGLEAVGTQQDEVEASSNSSSDSELPINHIVPLFEPFAEQSTFIVTECTDGTSRFNGGELAM
ncbi:hypothetical protein DFJ43DRAFT_1042930 [Lentinula guzmanii]|uniref:Uncharacterized protein n=1 Tax=Lentinula guzmanii TaxID=2804957 RepID=A0AA38J3Q0_9AGAR|nr:hypothetical protein DFJ43DRAFT_1042930 [Lentinula guzmanii]